MKMKTQLPKPVGYNESRLKKDVRALRAYISESRVIN